MTVCHSSYTIVQRRTKKYLKKKYLSNCSAIKSFLHSYCYKTEVNLSYMVNIDIFLAKITRPLHTYRWQLVTGFVRAWGNLHMHNECCFLSPAHQDCCQGLQPPRHCSFSVLLYSWTLDVWTMGWKQGGKCYRGDWYAFLFP